MSACILNVLDWECASTKVMKELLTDADFKLLKEVIQLQEHL